MSLKLKRYEVTPGLLGALESISELELPTAASYNASRLKRKVAAILEENVLFLKKTCLPFLEENPETPDLVDMTKFKTPEDKKECHSLLDTFLQEEIKVESYPITLSSLSDFRISVNDLDALGPVLLIECEESDS